LVKQTTGGQVFQKQVGGSVKEASEEKKSLRGRGEEAVEGIFLRRGGLRAKEERTQKKERGQGRALGGIAGAGSSIRMDFLKESVPGKEEAAKEEVKSTGKGRVRPVSKNLEQRTEKKEKKATASKKERQKKTKKGFEAKSEEARRLRDLGKKRGISDRAREEQITSGQCGGIRRRKVQSKGTQVRGKGKGCVASGLEKAGVTKAERDRGGLRNR